MRLTAQLQRWLIYAAFAALTTGCTTKFYRESADKESYKAIRNKSPAVPNKDTNFTIEQTNLVSLATLPLTTNAPDFLGADAQKDASNNPNAPPPDASADVVKARSDAEVKVADAQYDVDKAKAEAAKQVADARCESQAGDANKQCLATAKADYDAAVAAAKAKNDAVHAAH